MKRVFYGPTASGKSYLILRGLRDKDKVVVVTTNGVREEFEHVGLEDVPVKEMPITMELPPEGGELKVNIGNAEEFDAVSFGKIGFSLKAVPQLHQVKAVAVVVDWLEKLGIADDSASTIVLIGLYWEMNDLDFVKRIENWKADVIVEHQGDKRDMEQGTMGYISTESNWTVVPLLKGENLQNMVPCCDQS